MRGDQQYAKFIGELTDLREGNVEDRVSRAKGDEDSHLVV